MSVKLKASDSEEFTVERAVAEKSVLIRTMLEDLGESEIPIPLPNVTGRILRKVLDWCEHHRNEPNPDPSTEEKLPRTCDDISEWDAEYCKIEQSMLFEVMLAANYMDIKPLLDLTCKTVAKLISDCKTPEEIRQKFDIPNEYTPEEEKTLREENAWCQAFGEN